MLVLWSLLSLVKGSGAGLGRMGWDGGRLCCSRERVVGSKLQQE